MNLVGGYYDAGDHVKFGLPMAFTVTMLAWSAVDFNHELVGLNQMGHTLESIKWGTDYFIKAHPSPFVLWGQVQLQNKHFSPTLFLLVKLEKQRERESQMVVEQ